MDELLTAAHAAELDRRDPLAAYRQRFVVDDPDLIYLDGNSLGRLPHATHQRLREVVAREWGGRLIRGWNEGWYEASERLGARLATLLGAAGDEVIVADATSVNLFKLALAAVQARPERSTILTDDLNFPSDLYILQSVARLAGRPVRVRRLTSEDGIHGPVAALAETIDDDTALVALSHTAFKSGYTYDMPRITALAQRQGAMMLWDVSHSVGVVDIDLAAAGVDLAVGCTYKYLNGGPGAPAFLYVRRDWQEQLANPITGWLGHQQPFAFAPDYEPSSGMRRFLSGTPPILSLYGIEAGVDMVLEAGIEAVRAKSVRQTEYLVDLYHRWLSDIGFRLFSPADAARRGSHVSLAHPESYRIDQALITEMDVLPDFRQPDVLRLGLAPLYTNFAEIHEAVQRLRRVVDERRYEGYAHRPLAVT